MKVDDKGWLVPDAGDPSVKRYPTVRTYALATKEPLGNVWHTTDDVGGPNYGDLLAQRIQRYRPRVDRAASWHLLIARNGTLFQSASFLVGTWHVGVGGVIAGRRFDNINHATTGIELENAGRLTLLGEQAYRWPYFVDPQAPAPQRRPDPKCAVDRSRAVATSAGWFDGFTLAQELSAGVVLRALVQRYGWTRETASYGHVEFDPAHREDPGPVWKQTVLPRVLEHAFGPVTKTEPAGVAG